MPERFLVTSALPYINGVKHLGNLIGSLLPADIYARFRRHQGHEVLAVCGTDEHGTPAEIAAVEERLPVQEYARKYYEKQKGIYDRFGLSFDYFGRTSSPENRQITQHIFLKLYNNGMVTERETQQLYSVDDGRFLPDRFVTGTCPRCGYERARGDQCESCTALLDPTDLVNPRSAISGSSRLEQRKSKHLFINLPKMESRIRQWLGTKNVWPRTTISIANKWLNEGLRERCITRDLTWGVPVPLQGYEDKVFYVWFDAPIGYIGISIEWAKHAANSPDAWMSWWKSPDVRLVQFMAKDNIPFHTVTWPATMMGADDGFILADFIKGFEWLNYEGGKFSTSQNRGVFTDRALELFPPDYWRYALVFMAPEGADTSFTWEKFQMCVNKDLADNLGNFINRVLSFTLRFAGGVVPKRGPLAAADEAAMKAAQDAVAAVTREYESVEMRKALLATRELWDACNQYFENKKPWEERKKSPESLGTTLNVAAHLCRTVAVLSAPLIPFTAQKIFDYLGLNERVEKVNWDRAADFDCVTGHKVAPDVAPLVTKMDDKRVEELKQEFAGK